MADSVVPKLRIWRPFAAIFLSAAVLSTALAQKTTVDPLPSWNEGAAKQAILGFVEKVTAEGSADFLPPAERIAAFDNDGTLWCEQPMYFQVLFAFDRIRALAPKHPEWKDKEPFKSFLAGDMEGLAESGKKGLLEIIAATHAGMTVDEFHAIVREWMRSARHPKYNRPYNQCIYQPMVEVLAKALTLYAAYQYGEEKQKGSIEVGKLADLVIVSRNPMTIEPDKIMDIKVLETIKEGRTVYKARPVTN